MSKNGPHILAAELHGVIPYGHSKDRTLAKHSVLYEMFVKIKGKWTIFQFPKCIVGSLHIPEQFKF
jgi:hypothetical protein